jgi:predicted DsbA family dithiol-disulfide isomerase
VRIDRLRKEYEVQVKWVAFPLHPETPEEGLTLGELFAGRAVDIPGILQRLKRVAETLGLPLADRTKTYNSRLAQELAKWAESEGKGDEFHSAVFRTYFVEGKNIAKVDELVTLAASLGLPGDAARHVVRARTFREDVDADWTRSRVLGITAVPTFVIDGPRIVGFQPYEFLEQFLKRCGVEKRKYGRREHGIAEQ